MNTTEHRCEYCGTIFIDYKSNNRKYCSRDCYNLSHTDSMKSVICEHCGNTFEVKEWSNQMYCSRKCAYPNTNNEKKESICMYCGKTFIPTRNTSGKFCSNACVGKHNQLRYQSERKNIDWIRVCEWCGNEFEIKHSKSEQKYCCRKCHSESMTELIGDKNPLYTSTTETCEWCGAGVIKIPSQLRSHTFCSRQCNGKWNSENIIGESHPRWSGNDLVYTCDNCGEIFRAKSATPNNKHHFCSQPCRHEYMCGENSAFWKGESAHLTYPREFDINIKETIRNRDNRICQMCSKPENECDKRLYIHHIDENKDNSNLLNLISLCSQCHSKIHSKDNPWKDHFTTIAMENTLKQQELDARTTFIDIGDT